MRKEILVSVEFHEKRVAVVEDGRLEEYYVERFSDKQLVGSIFKGRVSSIVPGIGAAFIDMGLEKNGFLYVSDVVGQGGLDTEDADFGDNNDAPKVEPKEKQRHGQEGGRRHDKPHEPMPQIQDVLKKDQDVLVQVVKEPFEFEA